MYILGIESSCDETAAAVVKNGRELLSNVVATSVAEQALYGGVVPEIASRRHVEFISGAVQQALADARLTPADLAGVATFKRRLKAAQAELEREFAACWDDAQRREEAERLVRRMQFLDKLAQEVRQLEERLDD